MLFIRQEIDRQRQPTPGQHRDQAVLAKGADHTIEGHGGDVTDHGAQLQTEATVRGDQGIAGHVRPHLSVAQDEVGQDGEYML